MDWQDSLQKLAPATFTKGFGPFEASSFGQINPDTGTYSNKNWTMPSVAFTNFGANTNTNANANATSWDAPAGPAFSMVPTCHPMHAFIYMKHEELPEKCTTFYKCSKCGKEDEAISVVNKNTGLTVQAKFPTWAGCAK